MSRLNDAKLTDARFDQIIFDNTNLTVVDWNLIKTLGDERLARRREARERERNRTPDILN